MSWFVSCLTSVFQNHLSRKKCLDSITDHSISDNAIYNWNGLFPEHGLATPHWFSFSARYETAQMICSGFFYWFFINIILKAYFHLRCAAQCWDRHRYVAMCSMWTRCAVLHIDSRVMVNQHLIAREAESWIFIVSCTLWWHEIFNRFIVTIMAYLYSTRN